MRKILIIAGLTLAAFGCKSLLQTTITTTPIDVKTPIIGFGSDSIGKVVFYVEKYLPFEDVPANIVEIRGMTSYWKDSSGVSEISYTIWFSDTGNVAKDADSVKLYASLDCTANAIVCSTYVSLLESAGYTLEDPDTSFRMKLLSGTTQPGTLKSYEYDLPQDAVDLMDRCLVKGGLYQLIQVSIDVPSTTDTLYIKDLYQEITIGIR